MKRVGYVQVNYEIYNNTTKVLLKEVSKFPLYTVTADLGVTKVYTAVSLNIVSNDFVINVYKILEPVTHLVCAKKYK